MYRVWNWFRNYFSIFIKKISDSKILGIEKNIDLVNLAKKNLKENNITQNSAEVVQNDLDDNFS